VKICSKCNEKKELMLFAKGKRYKDGRRNVCKKCHTAYVTAYYNNNPEKKAAKNKMNSVYQNNWIRHRISEERYNQLLNLHNGKCHSCKDKMAVSIDHDHNCCNQARSCGQCVRGVLCNQCNSALGLLQENKKKIQGLLDYIG
jgi:hypothetical protein